MTINPTSINLRNLVASMIIAVSFFNLNLFAVNLISPETIALQRQQTTVFEEGGKLPILLRQSPGSEIIELRLNFNYGFKDAKDQEKVTADILFDILPKAAKNISKEQVFTELDRYSAGISCSFGIEFSSCSLSTIDRYFDKLLPLFVTLVKEPLLAEQDFLLSKKAKIAATKTQMQDPASSANEAVNEIFYPENHPYFIGSEQKLALLGTAQQKDLPKIHQQLLRQHLDSIVVVSSLKPDVLKKKLRTAFADFGYQKTRSLKNIPAANKKAGKNLVFKSRQIPTAYIRIKMQMPGFTDNDSVATNFMMKVLDEELSLEIRTRRSLSYAVFSYVIDYQLGIGIIGVTTSKPEETLSAISQVLRRFKKQPFASKTDLEEHQTVYTTSYFLDLEDHASIAASLSSFWYYHHSIDRLYNSPLELAAVSTDDVKRVANQYLKDFKVGVVYDKEKFKAEWVNNFLKDQL